MKKVSAKTTFLKNYQAAKKGLFDFVYSLSEDQLSGAKDHVGWSVIDHLMHLVDWQNGITALLQKKSRWKAMGLTMDQVKKQFDFDLINETLKAKHKKKTSKQVIAELKRADRRFLDAIKKLKDRDLKKPYRHFDPTAQGERYDRSIIEWIKGDGDEHYREHLPWMKKIVTDNRARKIELYSKGVDMLDEILAEVPLAAWQFKPSKKDWSIHEVLIHLADSETNSYLRCRRALAQPGQAIMAYDQEMWANTLNYHDQNTDDARAVLKLVRKMTHDLITKIPEADWSKTYFHPESGRQVTLDGWLDVYAAHIPGHIEQIKNNYAIWLKRGS
jgi:uncharacterized damage-inducible protein DinB